MAAISPDIIHSLTEDASQIRFAACHLRLKHTSIIVFTVYLWDSQGWSAENHTIMQHIKTIADIFDVPIIIVGDFNMLPSEFNDSSWCNHLRAGLVLPPTSTTLSKTSDRLIDYIIVSNSIRHIIHDVTAVQDTPWRHHGIAFKINARPRTLHSTSLMRPKALPLAEATQVYSIMNDYCKYQAYLKASRKAREILRRQRTVSYTHLTLPTKA